jgi:hypothetical protein
MCASSWFQNVVSKLADSDPNEVIYYVSGVAYADLGSMRTVFARAALGSSMVNMPSFSVALAFEASTSAGRETTRRISSPLTNDGMTFLYDLWKSGRSPCPFDLCAV